MQIPQAPMEQQQMMLTQQGTCQRQDRSSDTVHQFPLHSENGINDEWMCESSDEEPCMLAASLEANSDDEEEQALETENETINEEYTLIEFFPMFTVKELHADLQGTVQENVWDLTGKEVGLIRGVEPIKITLKPNVVFPQIPQYNMAQDVLMKVTQIIGDFLKQGVMEEVLSSQCNSPIMDLKKPSGKVCIVQDLRKVNDLVVKYCPVVLNPAVILFQIPCDAEWFTVVDLSQAFLFCASP
ncbi:hypothetical protein NDU88_003642 [Pleurodeles waltl]|uniref:Uncharacterized protein n=1 Tax=Pleurodeles waltl TaxID=8319 RepID=A0AAV7PD85_PLEWA|nr:hypothetical protein NDU88_003642 [Pleurodeles waltl]